MAKLPANLPKLLRAAGLNVVVLDGWRKRGRPAYTGSFAPVGTLWHHTGDRANGLAYARWLGLVGRRDLPAPLCQLSIDRQGTVYVVAAGRANHAGRAKPSGSVAGGDGNSLYVGIECQNTGTEGWSAAQYDAMVTTGWVLHNQVLHTSTRACSAHYQTSLTGKWDPGDPHGVRFKNVRVLDMAKFRADIGNHEEDDMGYSEKQLRRIFLDALATKRGQRLIRRAVLKDMVTNNRSKANRANRKNDKIWLNTAVQRILENTDGRDD